MCPTEIYIPEETSGVIEKKKAAEGTWMISGANTKALCHFFLFEASCDNANSPVLHWPICRVSEGGMSHCPMMGHEMPVMC